MDDTRLDIALGYAARGLAVLPVYGYKNGMCLCGNPNCEHPGKHPMTHKGVTSATTDPETITRWFEAAPDANIGIATGKVSNVWVLDIDGEEGYESYDKLVVLYGEPGETWTAQTGGGGGHMYFRYPENYSSVRNKVGAAPHVDVRGDGGYVVAPPSDHKSGNKYEWVVDPELNDIAEVSPTWAEAFAKFGIFANGEQRASRDRVSEPVAETFPKGQRNDGMFKLASSLRAKGLTQQEILAALMEANKTRCIPPLRDDEVQLIASSASRYERGQSEEFKPKTDDVWGRDNSKAPKQKPKLNTFRAADVNLDELPETSWVWEGRLSTGLALLAGAPKVGKSWMALDLALHVAGGKDYLGRPTTQGDVLYMGLEDRDRRVMLRLRDLLDEGEKVPQSLIISNDIIPLDKGLTDALEEKIEEEMPNPKLIIIDTLGKVRGMAGRAENAYQYDTREMTALKQLADSHDMCILLVHHKRKAAGAGDDIFDKISGTNGIFGAMDTTMLLDGIRNDASMREASLALTGRDIESTTIAVSFKHGRWCIDSTRPGNLSAEELEMMANPTVKAIVAWAERDRHIEWQGSMNDLRTKLLEHGLDSSSPEAVGRFLAKYRYDLLDRFDINVQMQRTRTRRLWTVRYKTDTQLNFVPIEDKDVPPEWA